MGLREAGTVPRVAQGFVVFSPVPELAMRDAVVLEGLDRCTAFGDFSADSEAFDVWGRVGAHDREEGHEAA